MTTLHFVRSARKTRKKYGIKRGHPYYWWKFSRCEKQYSLTRPRRSAYLTRSPFLRTLMDLEDSLDPDMETGDLVAALEDAGSTIEELTGEVGANAENVREKFPQGCPTLELLEGRLEALESIGQDIGTAISALNGDDHTREDREAALNGINWEYE